MSKKPKLTPWFPGGEKPARDGVYERDHISWGRCYSLFSMGVWLLPAATPEIAMTETVESSRQREPWRGLTENPSPGAAQENTP